MSESLPIQKEFGEVERLGNKIQIKKFGTERVVGQIVLLQKTEPIPHYLAHWLWVGRKDQGKGFASQIMSEVERVSDESGIPVVLHEAIDLEQNQHAADIYEKRRGWTGFENGFDRCYEQHNTYLRSK